MTALADIAPRLASARDTYATSERAWDAERRRLIAARCELQRLVAHRELQVIRSESRRTARRDTRYMTWRQCKLDRAQASLARVEEALSTLERTPPGYWTGGRR